MAFAEELSAFFDTDEFAVTATLADGRSDSFPVIFDNAFMGALGGQISATQSQCAAQDSDIARVGLVINDPLVINGTDYTVRDFQPAGVDVTLIILEAA